MQLRIDQVTLATDRRDYVFNLKGQSSLLEGPIGTGKSSLLELIEYGLGGSATLTPVVRQEVSHVVIRLRVNGAPLVVRRALGRGGALAEVSDDGDFDNARVVSIRPRMDVPTLSESLLGALDFPLLRMPRARANPSSATVPITFNDLFNYLYVGQQEIDRSIVRHTDSFVNPKRRTLFEVMFGITQASRLRAEMELGQVRDDIRVARSRQSAVDSFLATATPGDESHLRAELVTLEEERRTAERNLDSLRSNVEADTAQFSALREAVREAERDARSAVDEAQAAAAEVQRRQRLLAQYRLDMTRHLKAHVADLRLGQFDFVVCPRCSQELSGRPIADGQCTLCLQPYVSGPQGKGDPDQDEVDATLDEMEVLLQSAEERSRHSEEQVAHMQGRLDELRGALDRASEGAVTPRFAEIERFSANHARALAGIESVQAFLRFWEERSLLEQTVTDLDQKRRELELTLSDSDRRSSYQTEVLTDLSALFEETVANLEVPWAEHAAIDPRTYLPTINGEPFDTIAVAGGMKTIVTVAYHLTLLSYSLAHGDTLLPSLLILDTPRKNLGANDSDRAMGERIYRRIQTLIDAYRGTVQFIVADNDVPQAGNWDIHHFDYDSPLIRHVAHPGPDAVARGELETIGRD